MPFLDLDDTQKFSNWNKIWIYIVMSLIATMMTFSASRIWDRFLSSRRQSTSSTQGVDAEIPPIDNVHILEPDPHVDATMEDVLNHVHNILNKKDDDDNDSEGVSDDDPSADIVSMDANYQVTPTRDMATSTTSGASLHRPTSVSRRNPQAEMPNLKITASISHHPPDKRTGDPSRGTA
jgi:hypothetical protein